ncbi:exosome complex protein Rrp42 [Candidatus Micrarchaeota archaeon]|jgi:exosome complex component RRP42|nr:exosome complex protein Rrp42 [Candidatus Micrarchaeota archaeon]
MEILDQLKRDTIQSLVSAGKRADDRDNFSYRDISVKKNILEYSEGSALVRVGKSQVLCAIKIGIGEPFPDRLDEGILTTSAELMPLASYLFDPGPPSDEAIELARIVDRGVRAAEIIDVKKLYISENKVFVVYIDVYVMDHDGNLIDAAGLAAMAALQCTRMPKIENGQIVKGEYEGKLDLLKDVTTHTFAKVGNTLLIDPCLDEEKGMDARVTLGITDKNTICAIQKWGSGSFSQDELFQVIDIAFKKRKELKELIDNA